MSLENDSSINWPPSNFVLCNSYLFFYLIFLQIWLNFHSTIDLSNCDLWLFPFMFFMWHLWEKFVAQILLIPRILMKCLLCFGKINIFSTFHKEIIASKSIIIMTFRRHLNVLANYNKAKFSCFMKFSWILAGKTHSENIKPITLKNFQCKAVMLSRFSKFYLVFFLFC